MNEILAAINNIETELNPKNGFSDSEYRKYLESFEILKSNLTAVESGLDVPQAIELGQLDLGFAGINNLPFASFLLPFKDGHNLMFETNDSNNDFVCQQIQAIAVNICQSIKPDVCKFTVIDFARDSFPYLIKLGSPFVKMISKRDELRKTIDAAFTTATRIKADYLISGFETLSEYNTSPNTKYPEPYNIFICANFYNQDYSQEDVQDILALAKKRDAGFYFIFSVNPKSIKINTFFEETNLDINVAYNIIKFNKNEPSLVNSSLLPNFISFIPTPFSSPALNSQVEILRDLIRAYDNTANFISIPIGSKGGKPFYFELGDKAQAHSVLIGGRARSGKTSLLNNVITQIGENYSTDEIRLFLLDYKEGVEFSVYEDHPNVEMLLLDNSKIELGIDVLKKMQNQITERGKLFTDLGVRNLDSFNAKSETKLPRILTIIDEFQKMFEVRADAKSVNQLLSDVARRGQGFGLHLVLCSQSLQDRGLEQETLNQIALRIVLQIDRTECSRFLSPGNEAPAHLTTGVSGQRQGVYNAGGGIEKFNQIINLDYVPDDEVKRRLLISKARNSVQPIHRQIIKPSEFTEAPTNDSLTEKPEADKANDAWASFSNRFSKK
jgi:S-DNA-T family DNA segregation ATPase FtsK/SpoIIIE